MSTETTVSSKNNLATTSRVLGILAIVCFPLIGAGFANLLGIPAIITGVISLKQIKENGNKGKGAAITGIVLGTLPLILFLFLMLMGPIIGDVFNEINSTLVQ